MRTAKEADMFAIKIDLLMKRLDERAAEKEVMMKSTVQAMDSHMTCEVRDNVGHSGNDHPETCEEAAFVNNGFHQQGNDEWNNQ